MLLFLFIDNIDCLKVWLQEHKSAVMILKWIELCKDITTDVEQGVVVFHCSVLYFAYKN